jgi:hypothetical protein
MAYNLTTHHLDKALEFSITNELLSEKKKSMYLTSRHEFHNSPSKHSSIAKTIHAIEQLY